MAAELLFVPFKKSSDVDIVKPLRNLIHSTYNTSDHHEDYTEALNELSRLRANAIWKVFEKTSLDIIYNYHDQLASLESKIPPQEVQIPFKWKDAFDKGSLFGGRMSLTISSLAYERMCILFNIAAMQSLIASQQPVETEESLKQAAKLFQQAAGVFLYLKANIMMAVHQETTPDLHPETLDALAKLMLAQAQEVIALKCIRDEMKDSMVAKVCAQCEELYTDALRLMQKEQLKSLWERDWLTVVSTKQLAFRGLAQLYQAQVCHAAKSVGEEIARLQLAEELLRQAGRAAGAAGAWLGEQAARAARALAAARRDNDFIYHSRVPEPGALEPPARAAVARPAEPPARWAAARDLFGALVPLPVHAALQASAARRAELVAREVGALRDATQLLNGVLAALSLPACLEGAGPGALPDSIRARAAAVRAAGGLPELARLMAELPDLLQRNKDILDEAERMLREEAEADAALRQQFGPRWARTDSAKLTEAFRANADKYRQIIDNAVRADDIVQQKFAQHRDNIALLGGSERELSAGVPDAPDGPAPDAAEPDAAARLRALMDDVETLKAERDAIEAELKDTTVDLREQFLGALAADGCVDEPALSAAPRRRHAGAAGRAAGAAAGRARRAAGGPRRRQRPRRRAGPPGRRRRRLPGAHGQPQRGHQVLQRPHAAAGGVPEQGVGLLLRAQDGEGRAAEGPDAGGVPRLRAARARSAAAPRRRRARRPPGAAPAPPAARRLRARRRPRPRRPRRRRAAVPAAAARHAGAVRRGRRALPVLRGAHAAAVQPVRHAAVPAPRAAHAAAAALPALPVPRALALRPAAAARRLRPLPAAVAAPLASLHVITTRRAVATGITGDSIKQFIMCACESIIKIK